MKRRIFLKQSVAISAGFGLLGVSCNNTTQSNASEGQADSTAMASSSKDLIYKISLAEWSFHKALFAKQMDNLDFPKKTRELGIEGIEFVNQFFKDKAKNEKYMAELKNICSNEGVQSGLIMIDGEGALGDPDEAARMQAVENHYQWIDAAKYLGCEAIRVNAQSQGSFEEQQKLAADGLSKLGEYGTKQGIAVIVENHGGLSSNGEWLAGVMKMVNNSNVGTLPDFGNFCVKRTDTGCDEEYDRYKGVKEMMPYAKKVSAKTYAFNGQGEETTIDYEKMMKIVLDAGYRGYVGIEYEGDGMSEEEGVIASKKLLEKVRDNLSAQHS